MDHNVARRRLEPKWERLLEARDGSIKSSQHFEFLADDVEIEPEMELSAEEAAVHTEPATYRIYPPGVYWMHARLLGEQGEGGHAIAANRGPGPRPSAHGR